MLLSTAIVVASTQPLLGQEAFANAARQQAENFSRSTSAASHVDPNGMALPQEASEADKQADADLGEQWVLRQNERPLRFNIFADVSGFHTSNVALANRDEQADSFLVTTVGASYVRPITDLLVLNISLAEMFFRYDRFTEFDFNSFNAGLGVTMPVKPLWDANIGLQYNFNSLTHDVVSQQLFSGHSFTLFGSKTIQLTSADSLTFGASSAFNLSEPSSLVRGDASLSVGYDLALSRQFSVSGNYRVSFYDYVNTGRRDLNQTMAIGLRFNVNRWFSLNFSTSGTFNASSENAFQYEALSFGGGVAATFRF